MNVNFLPCFFRVFKKKLINIKTTPNIPKGKNTNIMGINTRLHACSQEERETRLRVVNTTAKIIKAKPIRKSQLLRGFCAGVSAPSFLSGILF
jgi:hypothetical protein